MLLRGSASVLLQQDGGRPGGRLGWQEDLKRGRTRGTPGSPSRTEEDTLTDFAQCPCSEENFHTGGSYATLMAFRIEKEKLAGEIFQLVCAYKDGNQQH